MQKKYWRYKGENIWYSHSQMVQQNCQEGLRIPKTHSKAGTNCRERRCQWRTSRRTGKGLNRQNQKMMLKPGEISVWPVQGDFICRHHIETRPQLHVPKEETFSMPLKYIDVTRRESKCIRFLDRIHKVWRRNLQRDIWSGERLTKIQATTRLDNVSLEVWTKIGKAAQKWENREWANEKPNSTMLEDWVAFILSIREDEEYREVLKNARRKLERPMVAAMPCKKRKKRSSFQETEAMSCEPTRFQRQSMLALWRLMIPRDNVWNRLYRKIVNITSQAKTKTRLTHYNLAHKFLQRSSGQGVEEARAWQLDKVESKKEVTLETQGDKKESLLCYIDGRLSSQKMRS